MFFPAGQGRGGEGSQVGANSQGWVVIPIHVGNRRPTTEIARWLMRGTLLGETQVELESQDKGLLEEAV